MSGSRLSLLLGLTIPSVALPQGDPADTAKAVVLGVIYDSVARAPLAGATVQLVAYPEVGTRSYTTVADSTGAYLIEAVPLGKYVAGFFHPALDSLGMESPLRMVDVAAAGPMRVDLAIPSGGTLITGLCRGVAPADSTGLLIGRVREADTDAPLGGSTVVLMWSELTLGEGGVRYLRREVPAQTSDDGWYVLCGVPTDSELMARAHHGADSSGFIEIRVPARGILKRDFRIGSGDSLVAVTADTTRANVGAVRRGGGRLAGQVRGENGRPLAGARLLVWGSGVEGETDRQGEFTLRGLPTGTHSLEVRQIGYAPKLVAVDLSPRELATVMVVLERAAVLEPVRVFGKAPPRRSITGFLERRERGGFGRYLTREEIERVRPFRTTDVFRQLPGVNIVPSGSFGSVLLMRGGCSPVIYLDGLKLQDGSEELDQIVQPSDIAGVEVYTGLAGAPAEFPGNGCGSVVIWTGPQAR